MAVNNCEALHACTIADGMRPAHDAPQPSAAAGGCHVDQDSMAAPTSPLSTSAQPIYGFRVPAADDLPQPIEPQSTTTSETAAVDHHKHLTPPGLLSQLMVHQEPAPIPVLAFANKRRALAPEGKLQRATWGPRPPQDPPTARAAAPRLAAVHPYAARPQAAHPHPATRSIPCPVASLTASPASPATPPAASTATSPSSHALAASPPSGPPASNTLSRLDSLLFAHRGPSSASAPFIPPVLAPTPLHSPPPPPAAARRIPHSSSEPNLHSHAGHDAGLIPSLPASHPSGTSSPLSGPEAPGTPTRRDAMASAPSTHLPFAPAFVDDRQPPPEATSAPAPAPTSPGATRQPQPPTPTPAVASASTAPPAAHACTLRRINTQPPRASSPTAHPDPGSSPPTPTISLQPNPPSPTSPLSPIERPFHACAHPPPEPRVCLPPKLLAMMPKSALNPPHAPVVPHTFWGTNQHSACPYITWRGAAAPAGSDSDSSPPASPTPPHPQRARVPPLDGLAAAANSSASPATTVAPSGRRELPCQHTTDMYRGLDEESLDALYRRWQPYRSEGGTIHLDLPTMAAHIHDARLAQARRCHPEAAPPLRTPRPCPPHDTRTQWWCGRQEQGFADAVRGGVLPPYPPPALTPRGLQRIISGLFGAEQ